jgi:hypothetical protein
LQAGIDKRLNVFFPVTDKPPGFNVGKIVAFRRTPYGKSANGYAKYPGHIVFGEKLLRHSELPQFD